MYVVSVPSQAAPLGGNIITNITGKPYSLMKRFLVQLKGSFAGGFKVTQIAVVGFQLHMQTYDASSGYPYGQF